MDRRAAILVIALIVSGCGGTPAPSPGSASLTAPAASAASSVDPDTSGTPESGPIDGTAVSVTPGPDRFLAAADSENASRAAARSMADLAGQLGPDAPAFATAIDQRASDGLWRLVDAAAATADRVVLAAYHPARVVLAAYHPARPDAAPVDTIPTPGMSQLGPWVTSMMLVESSIGSDRAFSKSDHAVEEVAVGPDRGKVTTDSSVTVTPSGSRLVVDVDIKTSGEVSDAAGHLVFRINGSGHAHIEIQACPDSGGVASTTMAFTSSEDYFLAADGGRSGHSSQQDDQADAKIFANDEAHLDHETVDLKTGLAVKGGTKAAGAGQTDLTSSTVDAAGTLALGADGGATAAAGSFTAHDTTRAEIDRTYHAAEQLLAISVYTASKAAEKFWRSGKCIEVIVAPDGGDVAANSVTTVTAKVRHRFEGNELDKPVEATMTGVKSIEPAGQRQPAPASFTFTAGPKAKDAGVVTFKSVSNRGIGETTVTFTVGGGWTADKHDGQQSLKGQKCGGLGGVWRVDAKVDGEGFESTATRIATLDEATMHGTYTFKSVGTVSGAGDIVTTQTGTGRVSAVVQADGSVVMTFAATTVTSVAEGLGTKVTVKLTIPDLPITWAPGGTCPG